MSEYWYLICGLVAVLFLRLIKGKMPIPIWILAFVFWPLVILLVLAEISWQVKI